MTGIENIKRAVKLAAAFKNQTTTALADGFQTMDIFGFIDELSQLPEVIASADQLKEELNDLSLEERKELNELVLSLDVVAEEGTEQFIADALDWAFATYKVVTSITKK